VRVEKTGHYVTGGGYQAEVYEIRAAYCLGFVWPRDAGRTPAIWRVENGTIMGYMPGCELVQYIGPFEQPTVQ
jgi:hypothetical protein